MVWTILLHREFASELSALPLEVREAFAKSARVLEAFGPMLGRPLVDTLAGSKHANLKELRFNAADGVWRAVFAFDPHRRAVVLIAGDKTGVGQRQFYVRLIAKAEERYDAYLEELGHG